VVAEHLLVTIETLTLQNRRFRKRLPTFFAKEQPA
jgi:hypothetical protein